MHSERWRKLKAIFVDVVDLDSGARETALAAVAARDPALAAEVRSLLRGYEEASTRLLAVPATPLAAADARQAWRAADDARQAWRASDTNLVGRQLGPYRLQAILGGGGMGVVYEATRDEDGKRVAVKLLHGSADRQELEREVRAERLILAGLEHDNIARLIDGGVTDDGLPYFTMEFVEGRPIVEFCDQRQLDVAARLRLFRALCAAVEYAHQRLVVHCDIKPGNVVVTEAGVPKLLDFGIARLVHAHEPDADAPTVAMPTAMTPGYASPEQVRGLAVTTATDVYALGLLLYEMLTGQPAQRMNSFVPDEIVRVVCIEDPPRPSAAAPPARRRELAGDLDAIVLKALRKEPAQRYASAAALAEDVERYLSGQPVAARRGTLTYRTSRFLRRHWLPASAVAAIVILSLVAVAVTTAQSRRADRERVKAEQVTEFLVDLFKVSDPDEARSNALTAREVLDTGAKRVTQELRDQPDVQATLLDTIGRVYVNLGLYDAATALHRQAVDQRRRMSHGDSLEVADSLDQVGRSLFYASKYAEAEATHRQALTMRAALLGEGNPRSAQTVDYLALAIGSQGRYAEAEALHRQALDLYRAAYGAEHPQVANGLSNLASDLYDLRRYDECEALNRQALAMRRKTLGPDHRLVAWSLHNLANVLQKQRKYEQAEAMHREAIAALRRVHGGEHPDVALALGNLAVDLYKQDRYPEAEAVHREALAMNRKLLGNEHISVAFELFNLAQVLASEDRYAETEPMYREALIAFRRVLGPSHPHCGVSLGSLALALAAENHGPEAERAGREGLAIQRGNYPSDDIAVAAAEVDLAVALASTGAFPEAETLLAHARAVPGGEYEAPPGTVIELIAGRYAAAGRHAEAARTRALRAAYYAADGAATTPKP